MQRLLAERDGDSGQVTVQQTSPPTGRQTSGLRTDEELRGFFFGGGRPEDSETQHRGKVEGVEQGGISARATHMPNLPPSLVSTQSARMPTYPQGYGYYHSSPPTGLL